MLLVMNYVIIFHGFFFKFKVKELNSEKQSLENKLTELEKTVGELKGQQGQTLAEVTSMLSCPSCSSCIVIRDDTATCCIGAVTMLSLLLVTFIVDVIVDGDVVLFRHIQL
jgi:hypothetical protein